MNPVIDVAVNAEDWASLEAPSQLAEAAILAAIGETGVSLAPNSEISVLFCTDAFIRDLNRKWRGIDQPANVLSFPAGGGAASAPLLGDIVIAYETTAKEARAEGKPFDHHLAHLALHGFLHLLGYDHESHRQAEAMERRERLILARLGVPDPYAARGAAV